MCTVEVLLVSDVMRRTVYENVALPRPSARSICRRLFADEAPVARPSAAVLRDLQANIDQQAKERWNFDFQTGTPLPGRYQWEPVHPVASRVPPPDSVVEEVPTARKSDERQSTPAQKTSRSTTTTQSKITDFLHQRKRQRANESSLFSPKLKLRRLSNSNRNDRLSQSMTM